MTLIGAGGLSAAEGVTDCTDATLRAALAGSDHVQLACAVPIVLTNTLFIDHDLILEGTGEGATISGDHQWRVFEVAAGVTLDLRNITVAFGHGQGEPGVDGDMNNLDGKSAGGGAILSRGGSVHLWQCRFMTNSVAGGTGGAIFSAPIDGRNGDGLGGAIQILNGELFATNSLSSGNAAYGANGSTLGFNNAGGQALGGAISTSNATVYLIGCDFQNNQAQGGTGAYYELANAPSGDAAGGAVYLFHNFAFMANCQFTSNQTSSAKPRGIRDGVGGQAQGGAIAQVEGYPVAGLVRLHIEHTLFLNNHALGGAGIRFSQPGKASGGAIHGGPAEALHCQFMENFAQGGSGGTVGGDAQGGAIASSHILAVTNSFFHGNVARAGQPWKNSLGVIVPLYNGRAQGGAIYNADERPGITNLIMGQSTFAENRAEGAVGARGEGGMMFAGGEAEGGAIWCKATRFEGHDMTFYRNEARGGDWVENGTVPCPACGVGGNGLGGGIYFSSMTAELGWLTFDGNAAAGGQAGVSGSGIGGAFFRTNSAIRLFTSILNHGAAGGNCSPNVDSSTITGIANISSDNSCDYDQYSEGNLHDTDPHLGPLGDLGGPTLTIPLLDGSPALNATERLNGMFPFDQRGRPRPFGARADIGAFESSPPYSILGQLRGFQSEGIELTIEDAGGLSDHAGQYQFSGLEAGTYLVTPHDSASVFQPNQQSITVGPDAAYIDFTSFATNAITLERMDAGLRFTYAGPGEQSIRVQQSSHLPDWSHFTDAVTDHDGLFQWIENPLTNPIPRFYQAVYP